MGSSEIKERETVIWLLSCNTYTYTMYQKALITVAVPRVQETRDAIHQ